MSEITASNLDFLLPDGKTVIHHVQYKRHFFHLEIIDSDCLKYNKQLKNVALE